jgi:hypothetical protein
LTINTFGDISPRSKTVPVIPQRTRRQKKNRRSNKIDHGFELDDTGLSSFNPGLIGGVAAQVEKRKAKSQKKKRKGTGNNRRKNMTRARREG